MSSTSHSHRRPRRLLAAICAAALLAGAAACGTSAQAGDDATMRVAYLSTANYLTTVRDEPFLDETMGSTNVDFTGPYNPTDAYAAVLSGNADATSTGTGSFIKFLAQGQPWTAFAIEYYNGDSQGIVAAPGSGVESLDDLAGKKVAIIKRGGTGDYVLHKALEGSNVGVDDVDVVEMSPSNFPGGLHLRADRRAVVFRPEPRGRDGHAGREAARQRQRLRQPQRLDPHRLARLRDEAPRSRQGDVPGFRHESEAAAKRPAIITDAYRQFGASDRSPTRSRTSTCRRSCRSTPTDARCSKRRPRSTWTSASSTRCPTSRPRRWTATHERRRRARRRARWRVQGLRRARRARRRGPARRRRRDRRADRALRLRQVDAAAHRRRAARRRPRPGTHPQAASPSASRTRVSCPGCASGTT